MLLVATYESSKASVGGVRGKTKGETKPKLSRAVATDCDRREEKDELRSGRIV